MNRDLAMVDNEKRAAAAAAADEIQSGMTIGLGTGTTVAALIPILAARIRAGLRVRAVATSLATEAVARAAGITMVAFEDLTTVDLTLDGVDEIDRDLRAIKGGGGALLREKIVATASLRMIAMADSSKFSVALGTRALPVEILPFARAFVIGALAELGAVPVLRMAAGKPACTDQGNMLVDCQFATLPDPVMLNTALSAIPGVIGHGLFLTEIDALYLAQGDAVTRIERNAIAS